MSDLPTRKDALNVHALFENDRFILSLENWRIVQHITHEYGSERLKTEAEWQNNFDGTLMIITSNDLTSETTYRIESLIYDEILSYISNDTTNDNE